ncbi:MAG: tRNA (adenosine(37)-N6)-dimethylallyltransferase MiaA [Gammaproteobacteria bacterium]|nr:tRNA (adenosine(37)-N6)-dimethylallyltransferase MiaA [Gammaproteobacteria bacterium]
MSKPLPPAVFILGPTASGKTGLALELARHFPCEIISVDSALVYRDMDIGTAKPSVEELAAVPHHLIDVIDPAESYSAARFREDALRLMEEITGREKLPLLVGGTMLYYRALEQGLSDLPEADARLRQALEEQMETQGLEALHQRLKEIDPESASRIKPTDPQRILRALEVYELTGSALSEHYAKQEKDPLPYRVLRIALVPSDRQLLHQRIEQRFDQMLQQGFVDEVRHLYTRGDLDDSLPSIRAVGYRQVWQYLEGEWDYDTMRYKGIVATRQLAKRQLTWLRSTEGLEIYDSEFLDSEKLVDRVRGFLDNPDQAS